GPTIRDLDSPGGTFVNRRRLLPGVSLPLSDGDLIQLGGVQLRMVSQSATPRASANGPPAEPPRPPSSGGPFALRLPSGTVCRSWDDFLVVASQRWGELREELA